MVHKIFSKRLMVPTKQNLELLISGQYWALLKAKVLAHIGNSLKSSPFELYGRSDYIYETCLFSGNFSNLNIILNSKGESNNWSTTSKYNALSNGTMYGCILGVPPLTFKSETF